MSEFGAWLLFGLIGAILILILCILFWQPNETAAAAEEEVICPPGTYDIQKTIMLCWPELAAAFSQKEISGGVLLHWSGLSAEKGTILLSVTAGNMMYACMNAVSVLYKENDIPSSDFWILIAENGRKEQCVEEASAYLRSVSARIDAVYEEGTGIVREKYAFLTVKGRSRTVFRPENGKPEKLAEDTAFPFVYSKTAAQSVKALGKTIPVMQRLQFALRFLTGRRPYRNLIRLIPEADQWFRSSLVYNEKDNRMVLSSPAAPEKALSDVLRKAGLYGTSLYKESEQPDRLYCDAGSQAFRRAQEAVKQSYENIIPVPVISSEGTGWTGWQTVCFTPGDGAETEYYKKLIG